MTCCKETVTLVRHVPMMAEDRYECQVIRGASWYGQQGEEPALNGYHGRKVCIVRIPASSFSGKLPLPGDYLVRGELSQCTSTADFVHLEHFRVDDVADNRRGGLAHIAVSSRKRTNRGGFA